MSSERMKKLEASGLIGCLNETGVMSENYKDQQGGVMEERPLYELDELIDLLEAIRKDEGDTLNHPRAFLTLAYEIKKCRKTIRQKINTIKNYKMGLVKEE